MKLTDLQKVSLAIAPTDAAGNAASVESVSWKSSDESIVSLAVADDGLSATATAVGPLGTSQIEVSADAQIGDGVTTLTGLLDIEVVGSQAVSLGITAGTPEAK